MNEQFVSYQQAKDLKEIGFNEECFAWYNDKILQNFGDDLMLDMYANDPGRPFAPLHQQIIEWARKEHGLWVNIENDFYKNGVNINWNIMWYSLKEEWLDKDRESLSSGTYWYGDNAEFTTWPEVFHAVIDKIIYLIQTKIKTGVYKDYSHYDEILANVQKG